RTGGGSGKDEKSHLICLFSSREGVFYSPNKPRGQRSNTDIMDKNDGFMKALKCRECGREYALTATHVCEFDFGPLEVAYDYERIKRSLTRATIQARPQTMWRYRELLPVAGD